MALKPLGNEVELLAKIAIGDQRAFTIIFNHYQRDLYLFSKSLTKSEEAALEVVQDVFLKIWSVRTELLTIDNFAAYINRVVRNHSLNVLRKITRENKSVAHPERDHDEISDIIVDQATQQQLDYNDTIRFLDQALSDLPAQQRQVYDLCHIQGMKYEEVAQMLGISIETVRVHMKRAIRKIRLHFVRYVILYPLLLFTLVM